VFVFIPNQELNYEKAVVEERDARPLKRMREDSEGRVRSSSRVPRDETGVKDVKVIIVLIILNICDQMSL